MCRNMCLYVCVCVCVCVCVFVCGCSYGMDSKRKCLYLLEGFRNFVLLVVAQ